MPYNVNNRSITIFKLSVSFVYLLLLICYSFGVAVTGLDLILFPELFNLIVFPFNELSRSPVITLFCCTVSSLQEFIWILYWQCMYCAALCWSKPYQVRRGRNTKVFLPCFLPTCCSDNYQSFFASSQQPFPCMADSLHGSGHCAVWILWRISATSLIRQRFLDEVNQDSRVQHPPKRRCLGENAFQHR